MLFKDYDWYIEHEGSALLPEIELGLTTTIPYSSGIRMWQHPAMYSRWLEIKDEIKQQFEELVKKLDTMED